MTTDEIEKLFEQHDDEYLKFKKIKHKRSRFMDLHAFLLLEERFPNAKGDIVGGARHDEIFLSIDLPEEDIPLTEADVIELIRCGVRWDEESGSGFVMFA